MNAKKPSQYYIRRDLSCAYLYGEDSLPAGTNPDDIAVLAGTLVTDLGENDELSSLVLIEGNGTATVLCEDLLRVDDITCPDCFSKNVAPKAHNVEDDCAFDCHNCGCFFNPFHPQVQLDIALHEIKELRKLLGRLADYCVHVGVNDPRSVYQIPEIVAALNAAGKLR
jgi:hypothetical protein